MRWFPQEDLVLNETLIGRKLENLIAPEGGGGLAKNESLSCFVEPHCL